MRGLPIWLSDESVRWSHMVYVCQIELNHVVHLLYWYLLLLHVILGDRT